MRPSSLGGAAYCVTLCLSLCPSVCPSVPLLLTLENRSRVFVNLADVRYLFFVYMSGPHIVRRSQPHKLVLINGIVKYTSTLRCYGSELWLLSNKSIDEFAVAWRRAVRRVCAYLLARIVIFCHCLMNLCLSLLMFVRDLLVLFCLVLNQSLRLFVW